jgi:hypothetical protein
MGYGKKKMEVHRVLLGNPVISPEIKEIKMTRKIFPCGKILIPRRS